MVQSGQLGLGLRVYRVTPSQAARLRLAGPGPGMMPVIPGPAAAAGPRAGATYTGGRAAGPGTTVTQRATVPVCGIVRGRRR